MSFRARYQRALEITWPWGVSLFGITLLMGFLPWLLLESETEYAAETILRYQAPPLLEGPDALNRSTDEAVNQMTLTKEILLQSQEFQFFWQEEIDSRQPLAETDLTPESILDDRTFTIESQPQSEEDVENLRFRYRVSYQDTDPEYLTSVLDSFKSGLIRASRNENIADQKIQANRLEGEEVRILGLLEGAGGKLEDFSNFQKPSAIEMSDVNALTSEIANIRQNLRQLEIQFQSLATEIQGLQSRLGLSPQAAYVAAALSADPIISNLQTQIYDVATRMTSLRQELQPRHPEMVELQSQLDAFEIQLQKRLTDVVGNESASAQSRAANLRIEQIRQLSSLDPARQELANQLADLQTQREYFINQRSILTQAEQRLLSRLDLLESRYDLPQLELEESLLRSDFEALKQQYEQTKASRRQSDLRSEIARSNWVPESTTTPEEITTIPWLEIIVFPIGGVLVGTALFGLTPLLVLNDRLLNAKEVDAILDDIGASEVPVKRIPTIPGGSRSQIALAIGKNDKYLTAFEGLRTEVATHTTILITSITAGDGKSSTAYNLALAAAQTGRQTLLVELDVRSVSVATNLASVAANSSRLPPPPSENYYQSNLSEQITSAYDLMPKGVDVNNLWILPSQQVNQNLRQLLESEHVANLLTEAKREYDFLIVDAPSMWVDNAPTSLLGVVDALLLVVRPQNTPVERFRAVAESLHRQHPEKFAGVVVRDNSIYKSLL
jgi:Mrp family chromosome partitioning ATPase